MAWDEEEWRPFDLYETDDGLYYQAVGTKDNPERIEAIEIIKALRVASRLMLLAKSDLSKLDA